MLIKGKQGQLFGGYASEPWLKNGKFYGELNRRTHATQNAHYYSSLCAMLEPELVCAFCAQLQRFAVTVPSDICCA